MVNHRLASVLGVVSWLLPLQAPPHVCAQGATPEHRPASDATNTDHPKIRSLLPPGTPIVPWVEPPGAPSTTTGSLEGIRVRLVPLRKAFALGAPIGCTLDISNETGHTIALHLPDPPYEYLGLMPPQVPGIRQSGIEEPNEYLFMPSALESGRSEHRMVWLNRYLVVTAPGTWDVRYGLNVDVAPGGLTSSGRPKSLVFKGVLRLSFRRVDARSLEKEILSVIPRTPRGRGPDWESVSEALFFLDTPQACPALAALARNHDVGGPTLPYEIMLRIASFNDPGCLRLLRSLVFASEEGLWENALFYVGKKRILLTSPELHTLLAQHSGKDRLPIMNYLCKLKDKRYQGFLKLLASDPEPTVREPAAKCLAALLAGTALP